MAKVTGPLFSKSASGSMSPCLTFSSRNSGEQVRYQRKQKDRVTVARLPVRAAYSAAVSAWNLLTESEKSAYILRAQDEHYTGFNLFVKEYMASVFASSYAYYGTGAFGVFTFGSV